MSCLCLGNKGSGKTLLLNCLQNPSSVNSTSTSVATVGINIFSIKLPERKEGERKTIPKKIIQIKEVGGTMGKFYSTIEFTYQINTPISSTLEKILWWC